MQVLACMRGVRRVRSLMTTADASLQKSTEPLHRLSLRKLQQSLLPCPFSLVTPIVNPEGCQRRVLLLTSETALEAEVRDAVRIRQHAREILSYYFLS